MLQFDRLSKYFNLAIACAPCMYLYANTPSVHSMQVSRVPHERCAAAQTLLALQECMNPVALQPLSVKCSDTSASAAPSHAMLDVLTASVETTWCAHCGHMPCMQVSFAASNPLWPQPPHKNPEPQGSHHCTALTTTHYRLTCRAVCTYSLISPVNSLLGGIALATR